MARYDGRVVFVRHALPGEVVRARLTEAAETARFWRADAVAVRQASPDRVASPWPEAGPGGVGGAELGHVALPAQRAWKASVLGEQLRRLSGVIRDVEVEAAPSESDGLGWRTRVELVVDGAGRPGMHRYRSPDVVPLPAMPLGVPGLDLADLLARRWPPGSRLTAVAPVGGDRPLLLVDGVPWGANGPDRRRTARASVRERATVVGHEHVWRVSGTGFWQVHRDAPAVLAEAVAEAAAPVLAATTGATVLDLYSGAGLFTAVLARLAAEHGALVHAVEGDPRAVRDARRNLHDHPAAALHEGDVSRVLAAGLPERADLVVLDPPRAGARRGVVAAIAGRKPQRVGYVACDPAALARDVALLADHGYRLTGLRAFDLFPMTHHVEAVAVLDR